MSVAYVSKQTIHKLKYLPSTMKNCVNRRSVFYSSIMAAKLNEIVQ